MELEIQVDESTRLETLQSYQILDTPPENAFNDLVKLAAQLCETPIAAIALVDADRLWFKASFGLGVAEIGRALAFCDKTIGSKQPLIVADAREDARFAQSPLVLNEPFVRFYAGIPLIAPNGAALGTLAVMDRTPRELSALQLNALKVLADQVMAQLELRALHHQQGIQLAATRQTENELRESEKRFSRLFSSAAAGITLSDPQGHFLQANPAFCATVGYSEEELRSLDFLTITHPDDRQHNAELLQQLFAGEVDRFVLEKRYVRKDGELAWVRASISCLFSEQSEPLYVIGVTENITASVKAQQVVSTLQQRLAMTLENMTDAFCLLDREWRITYLNKVGERLVLHTAEQMHNVTLWERFPPTTNSALYSEFHRAMEERVPVHFELYYPPLNNWFEVHAYPMPDGLAVYFRVITERKQAIEAMRASEERFKIVARATNDAIWDWDLTTNAVWWNEGFINLFGYERDELETNLHFWTERIHPDDRDWVYNSIVEVLREGGENWGAEYRFVGKDGSIAHVLDRAYVIHNDEGKAIRMVGSMVDLTERKQAEEALRESEERFRQLAETIDDVFWIWDPHADRIIYASPRYEDVFCQPREELYRNPRSFARDIHPDDLERLQAAAAIDPTSIKLDYRLVLEGGETRWVSVSTFPVYDTDGNIRHSVGIGHDITQLMATTEQLRTSEQQYRLLFANNPHPMWVFDRETLRFLAVNEQAIAHYGYSEEEFLAMTLYDIRTAEELPRLKKALTRLNQSRDFDQWKHRKKDGTIIDVEVSSDAIEFYGRPARLVLATDVTARRRAEKQMRQQAALLDKAQDAIMICDLNHRISYWNHGAERLYGWKAEEAIGQTTKELLYRDPAMFQRAHQQLLVDGEWFGELQQVDRHGRDLLVEVRWTLMRDEEGKPQAVLSIKTDVTERKKLEAQFLRSQRMESIGTLAGGIAHDLNNVLAPILLSLGMLKRQSRTAAEQKLLNTLESSAQRGADMVRQVLTFARGVEGERVIVDVGQIVRDLEKLIRDTFDRSIRIYVTSEEKLLPVLGDPTQIHQVALNLCVNARDAMPNGGVLKVTVSTIHLDSKVATVDFGAKAGTYVVLCVADSGMGIPAAIRDSIFDPFFTTKEVGKGTGLGLATVQAVVKSHGGFLNLASEEGRGTEFKVYLPALESAVGSDTSTQSSQLPESNGELILVVDDESAIRLIAQQTLESFGYRVLTANGGVEATSLYTKHRADISVVLTDMMMPGMDGFATIQALRELNPEVKIIAASGLGGHETVAKASKAGARHFLQKPYTTESLLKVLREIREEMQQEKGHPAH